MSVRAASYLASGRPEGRAHFTFFTRTRAVAGVARWHEPGYQEPRYRERASPQTTSEVSRCPDAMANERCRARVPECQTRLTTGAIEVAADYSELGSLMLTASALGLIMPIFAIFLIRFLRWRSA
jgi:hypothetical protein